MSRNAVHVYHVMFVQNVHLLNQQTESVTHRDLYVPGKATPVPRSKVHYYRYIDNTPRPGSTLLVGSG